MEPRITRGALIVLSEDTLRISRRGPSKDRSYSRARLTASTLSRLNHITYRNGRPQLTYFGPDSRHYVGLIISIEINWSPDYAEYRERAIEAHAAKVMTFEEYRITASCMDRAKGGPMHSYYADLLFVEEVSNV